MGRIINNTGNVCLTQYWGALWNYCCSWKTVNITYSVCVFASLGAEREMKMRHIVMWLLRSTTFFHNIL